MCIPYSNHVSPPPPTHPKRLTTLLDKLLVSDTKSQQDGRDADCCSNLVVKLDSLAFASTFDMEDWEHKDRQN